MKSGKRSIAISWHLSFVGAVLVGMAISVGHAQTAPPAGPATVPNDEALAKRARAAVEKALAYCQLQQKADGSFPNGRGASDTAVPALVVMAFLAHGDLPGHGRYGDVLNKAIDYVLDSQQPDGLLARNMIGSVMYEHGVSTLMLTRAYGKMDAARRGRIGKALAKSVDLILAAQKVQKAAPAYAGGWRYTPHSPDSDLSVSGWQLLALHGAADCGVAVPAAALADGREFVKRCAVPTGGGFCYMPSPAAEANQARSGIGIECLEQIGDHNSPEAIAGGDYLLAHPLDNTDMPFYYYSVYYCSQAVNQLGGKYWTKIYPSLCNTLLAQQQPDGSFGGASSVHAESLGGPCYCTAMACLALSVRDHPPAFHK